MRVQIARHLKTRSQAIRNAVKAYNASAAALHPPRPTIQYANVLDMAFLGEFDLL